MVKRILRLFFAEIIKLSRQRLPIVAVLVIALVTFLSLYGAIHSVAAQVRKEQEGFQEEDPRNLPAGEDEGRGARTKTKDKGFFPKLPPSKGFECLAHTWRYSLGITSFFLLVFGSLLVSSEVASGTARTVLQRPVRRFEFLLAKVLMLAVAAVLGAVLVAGLGAWLVQMLVGFGDVTDLEYGKVFFTKAEMWGHIIKIFPTFLVPLACAGFLGFFVSSLAGSPGASVGIAVIAHYVLGTLLKIFQAWERYYFDFYFEQSLDWLRKLSQGIKTDVVALGEVNLTSMEYLVPAAYLLVFIIVPLLAFRRRDITT